MWKQKSDTIPTSNCFQLIEEQVSKKKKKKFYALSVLLLAWTPVREMRDQTKSRELTSYHQGNKTSYITCISPPLRFIFVLSSPSPFLGLFIKMLNPQCTAGQHQVCRTPGCQGGRQCLPSGGCPDSP